MTDSLFGVSEKALQLSEDRAAILTNNIVNSSTPHYKARDINFHQILQGQTTQGIPLATSSSGHISESINGSDTNENLLYRIPNQSNLDGNTVDEELERKSFIQNSLNYEASLTFIKSKADQIQKAIKGE